MDVVTKQSADTARKIGTYADRYFCSSDWYTTTKLGVFYFCSRALFFCSIERA